MTNHALYVAVSEWGYGIDRCPAEAIMKAQEHVPVKARPSQLLIYTADIVWEDEEESLIPATFPPVWDDSVHPRLIGLTDTHSLWGRRKR